MLLASCLDASGDPNELRDHVTTCLSSGMPELADEFEIRTKKVWRSAMGSIAGMQVTVRSKYNDKAAPVPKRTTEHNHSDGLDHHHGHNEHQTNPHHDHGHQHQHKHQHGDQHGHYHEHPSGATEADAEENEPATVGDDHGSALDSPAHDHSHGHSHGHSHSHAHNGAHNDHSHSHNHAGSNATSDGPLRNLREIRRLLEESDDRFIAPWVKAMAIAAFTELAKAEATTHGAESVEAVHFHEVGAVDSIVDTVGTLVALHYLGATSFSCSRLPIGEGTVWTDHGVLPVPAPATLRLMVGMPTCPGPLGVVTGELVTPTGAALLRALCLEGAGPETTTSRRQTLTGRPPSFTIRKVGIGAGTRDFEKHPNVLRLLLGDDVVTKS